MAQETNQTQVPMLCPTGCGFYGNPRTSGMCSVCYKEHLQRQQAGGRSSPTVATSPSGSPGAPTVTVETAPDPEPNAETTVPSVETRSSSSPVIQQLTAMSISQDTAASDSDRADAEEEDDDEALSRSTGPAAEAAQSSSDGDQTPDKNNKKKNRCFTCRKRVGLTGFDCRCGNLFCSAHRYSDTHKCTYDYKGAAAAQLRKENPIVVAEKIQKL